MNGVDQNDMMMRTKSSLDMNEQPLLDSVAHFAVFVGKTNT